MDAEQLFQLCNIIALVGWIILIIFPQWNRSDIFLTGVIITLLAIIYCWLIFQDFQVGDISKFGTIAGIQELFNNENVAAAGWVHYLAFDLMTGIFIRQNARLHNINYWITVPCLVLTFLLGPLGLLLYFLLRWVITKHYFAQNFE